MSTLDENDIALAGEYVLGLLDAAENAQAQARIATDAGFAGEVDAWRDRLQSLAAGNDTPAPEHIWSTIMARLSPSDVHDSGNRRLRLWQGLTALSATAAVFMAVLVWQQPAPAPIAPSAPLVAALGSETGKAAITARYDAQSGELLLTPVALDTGALYPELWVVPADGKARSLGMMATAKPTQVTVSPAMRQYMAQGAVLAITPEPQGGAPGGKATGAIIASGKIAAIG